MTRDFASKSKKRSNATRFKENAKESNTNFVMMALCLALGIVVTLTAVYFYQNSPTETPEQETAQNVEKPSAKNRYKAVPAEEVEQSDFSYHEELPNKTVDVETQSLPEAPKPTQTSWVMQCGSFRKMTSAENLKAQIAMSGFEAQIRSSRNAKNELWYRVVLGPYQSKRQAERERHELERNNINFCRIW